MQSILGIDKTDEERIEEYTAFLRENGFIVIPPSSLDTTSVKTPTSLVDLFYSMLQYHNQKRVIHYAKATKKDIGLAKSFLKHRQDVCGNKKQALRECALIVKCVVENEELFTFSEPIHSFACFGSDTMKWVSDRAISILNGENYEANERDYEVFMAELGEQQEKESLNCLDDRIKELKSFLGGSDDGEEKEKR